MPAQSITIFRFFFVCGKLGYVCVCIRKITEIDDEVSGWWPYAQNVRAPFTISLIRSYITDTLPRYIS